MKRENAYRFEYITDPESASGWGWDVVSADNFKTAKKWIMNYCKENGWELLYIAKMMWEKPEEK